MNTLYSHIFNKLDSFLDFNRKKTNPMKRIRKSIKAMGIISMLSLLATSCTEDYTDKIDKKFAGEKLVVESNITNLDTVHFVKLSLMKPYFEEGLAPAVIGATVQIRRDKTGDTETLTAVNGIPGLYQTTKRAFASGNDEFYTLIITNTGIEGDNGNDYYESQCQLRSKLDLDSIHLRIEPEFYDEDGDLDEDKLEMSGADKYWKEGQDIYAISSYAKESPIAGDYYRWIFYKNHILETDTLKEVIFESDEYVNGQDIIDLPMWYIGADSGDVITVETHTITEAYYDFIIGVMLETEWNAGPFGGPPANPRTNISNGALGFFAAYSVSIASDTLRIP